MKTFGILDVSADRLITEGDISNNSSTTPWLKDKKSEWELQDWIRENSQGPNFKVVYKIVPVTVAWIWNKPKT